MSAVKRRVRGWLIDRLDAVPKETYWTVRGERIKSEEARQWAAQQLQSEQARGRDLRADIVRTFRGDPKVCTVCGRNGLAEVYFKPDKRAVQCPEGHSITWGKAYPINVEQTIRAEVKAEYEDKLRALTAKNLRLLERLEELDDEFGPLPF